MDRVQRLPRYLLLMLFLFPSGLSGSLISAGDDTPPSSLHVPLVGQLASEWCWAACTEMVTRYYHDSINTAAPIMLQCSLVNLAFTWLPPLDCDTVNSGNPPSAAYDMSATPFPNLGNGNCNGYTTSSTLGAPYKALPWDSLVSRISQRMPVIFNWGYAGVLQSTGGPGTGGNHYLVAEGCPTSKYIPDNWISINDPEPVGRGTHRIISYFEYANKKPLTIEGDTLPYAWASHGYDMYDFNYTAPTK